MKSKVEIYALAVCFASVVCLVISAGIASYSVIGIIAPEITMSSYKYDKYQTNEAYTKSKRSCKKDKEFDSKLSDAEITIKRNESFAIEVNAEKRSGMQSLIKSLMFILVSSLALAIHWKIAKKSRGE